MPKLPRRLEQLELYCQPERIPDWKALPETVREEVLRNLTRMFRDQWERMAADREPGGARNGGKDQGASSESECRVVRPSILHVSGDPQRGEPTSAICHGATDSKPGMAGGVIDEDLGRSASGNVERIGFQRMVAEVCLGQVGVVAAREVSRFARNSKDWQQLIEVCRMVDTLLLDQEVVYDSRNSNDRLLLGLNRPDTQ